MKRVAGIHISRKNLHKVLKRILFEDKTEDEILVLTNAIMKEGYKYTLNNRSINVTNQKLLKSTKGMVTSETEDTNLFAHLLQMCRRRLKHRAVLQARPGTKEWKIIEGLIPNVNSFCEDFDLTKKEGYRLYIEIGLNKMNNFYLTNFSGLHEYIVNEYGATEELKNDFSPHRTEIAHSLYTKYLGERAITKNFKDEPTKMVFFKRVAEKSATLNVDIKHYIASQFEGLDWAKSIPEPHQLTTEAALTRLNKYLVKNDLKTNRESKQADDIAEKIKKQWSKLN